jgi:uroporphyrinogen III methyltransferase / synthase
MTRLLVTRPAGQAQELVSLLAGFGIEAVSVPTVSIAEAPGSDLDRALEKLHNAAWLVITSANGARAVLRRLAARDVAVRPTVRVAAVGPETAAALTSGGIRVDHVPDQFLTSAIAAGLGEVNGRLVVLARSDAATPDLAEILRSRGAQVEEIVAYRTLEGPAESRKALHAAFSERLDGITFTSGSTVRGLLELASDEDADSARALPAYCIGPVTADVARSEGFSVPVVAPDHTAAALAAAVHDYIARGIA